MSSLLKTKININICRLMTTITNKSHSQFEGTGCELHLEAWPSASLSYHIRRHGEWQTIATRQPLSLHKLVGVYYRQRPRCSKAVALSTYFWTSKNETRLSVIGSHKETSQKSCTLVTGNKSRKMFVHQRICHILHGALKSASSYTAM